MLSKINFDQFPVFKCGHITPFYTVLFIFILSITNVHSQISEFGLGDINGTNGFAINGIMELDYAGASVSHAGDINNDGFDDVVIGSPGAHVNLSTFMSGAGQVYVVFGNDTSDYTSVDLSNLDGNNGFTIYGANNGDDTGDMVRSGGDVNGDGIDDLLIGAPYGFATSNASGNCYVIFGSDSGFSANLYIGSLDGSNGFVIRGKDSFDECGSALSSADINGDGIDDIIIGANEANQGSNNYAGEAYVVFGSNNGFDQYFDLSDLDGNNGFLIVGLDGNNRTGVAVSKAGDVNADGIDDVIIGANLAEVNGNISAGESYVIFGNSAPFNAVFDLNDLDGNNGFTIQGKEENGYSGNFLSNAGDINADGIDDIVVCAYGANDSGNGQGEIYFVFGKSTPFTPILHPLSLNGTNGFTIYGFPARAVSAAGDVNGDGFDDVIFGQSFGNGDCYLLYGKDTPFDETIIIGNISGTDALHIVGNNNDESAGNAVGGSGDFNNDGYNDLIIGAYGAEVNGIDNVGKTYIVYGFPNVADATLPTCMAQDLTLQLDSNGYASISANDIDNGSFDNVDISSMSLDVTSFDISNIGINDVTLTVFDYNGNSSSCTSIVTVELIDATPPTCMTQDFTLQLDSTGNALLSVNDIDNGSFDNFDIDSMSLDITSFDISNIGNNDVILTVVDLNGNSSSCTSTVTVELVDATLPTCIAQDFTLQLDSTGNALLSVDDIDNGSFDNFDISSMSLDVTSFDISNIGNNDVTLTVVDLNGNSSSCTSTVTVEVEVQSSTSIINYNTTEITLFPNPVNDLIILSVANVNKPIDYVEIINNIGEIVFYKKVNSYELNQKIDFSNYSNGIFYLQVVSGGFKSTEKIIKY